MADRSMEKMSSSVQSWVEDHKLATVGWATAVGASVACSPRGRATATGLTVAAALGGAALAHHRYTVSAREKEEADLAAFYSQLPAATADDGRENERWTY